MPKLTTTIAAILTLLTGVVLGQLGALAMPRLQPFVPVSIVSAQDLATAHSFYDALNRFLATGEPGVESMLALDFIDHTDSLSSDRNAQRFITDWSATGAYFPQLQLEVVDARAAGALVAIRLEIHSGPTSAMPGIPLTVPAPGSVVEFLRIERARVAERWSGDNRLPGLAMAVATDFDRTGPSLGVPSIQHISISAGQAVAFSGEDTVVLRVISGELLLDRAAVDPQGGAHLTSHPVTGGQIRIVNLAGTLILRNLAQTASEFFVFSLYGLNPMDAADGAASGLEAMALAYVPLELTGSVDKRLRISVTKMTLPPGASVASHAPSLVEEILVLDGTLEVSVQSGRALFSSGNGSSQPFDGVETASAGQGFSASSIATLSYRVASAQSATLLIMTIEPVFSSEADA